MTTQEEIKQMETTERIREQMEGDEMYCNECENTFSPHSKYCEHCGNRLIPK